MPGGHMHGEHHATQGCECHVQTCQAVEGNARPGPHLRGHLVYQLIAKGAIEPVRHHLRITRPGPFRGDPGAPDVGQQQDRSGKVEQAGRYAHGNEAATRFMT